MCVWKECTHFTSLQRTYCRVHPPKITTSPFFGLGLIDNEHENIIDTRPNRCADWSCEFEWFRPWQYQSIALTVCMFVCVVWCALYTPLTPVPTWIWFIYFPPRARREHSPLDSVEFGDWCPFLSGRRRRCEESKKEATVSLRSVKTAKMIGKEAPRPNTDPRDECVIRCRFKVSFRFLPRIGFLFSQILPFFLYPTKKKTRPTFNNGKSRRVLPDLLEVFPHFFFWKSSATPLGKLVDTELMYGSL